MIQPAKINNALRAIHSIFVAARFMAYQEESHKGIAEVLDYAERLPWFIASEEDNTAEFRSYLEEMASKYPLCRVALNDFDEVSAPDRW